MVVTELPGAWRNTTVEGKVLRFVDLAGFGETHGINVSRLPYSIRVLLENLIRKWSGSETELLTLVGHLCRRSRTAGDYMDFYPARVLMQDYSGMPVILDMAGLRNHLAETSGSANIESVTPSIPVDFVVDHSLIVDEAGYADAHRRNLTNEFRRNDERYRFLRWAEQALENFRIFPPGAGILHQLNLEQIASVISTTVDGDGLIAIPDTVVGTDSHTTMINSAGVLGWGVGGIDAQAAALGEPLSIRIPEVVGVYLEGALPEGVTATDAVLTLTEALRRFDVVDCFVEFFGPALDTFGLADRGTISNMAPEFGSTCAYFPIDDLTLDYLRITGREPGQLELVREIACAQMLYRGEGVEHPDFDRVLKFDLSEVETSIAGPRRPQERVRLSDAPAALRTAFPAANFGEVLPEAELANGDVVLAAITSCTNTSNPALMFGAGLIARNAVQRGLITKPWIKTSFTPGSPVVASYLADAGLQQSLDELGFHVAGFACGTCSGNSGNLNPDIAQQLENNDLIVCSVLSGNRNFEGRIHPHIRGNFLMTPALVVAYALLGRMTDNLRTTPLGQDRKGNDVFLKDIWPSNDEVNALVRQYVNSESYRRQDARTLKDRARWDSLPQQSGELFEWDASSTYLRCPTIVTPKRGQSRGAIANARPLLLLGDNVTTDHISPVGDIVKDSPAALYLSGLGVLPAEFNTYGARRGNHEIMIRGTFANPHISNRIAGTPPGPYTRHFPSGDVLSVYDAAVRYESEGVELIVIGGKNYGGGSARDWAARGTRYLGIKAVVAQGYERIHRANLVNMGIHALEFMDGDTAQTLRLDGSETFDIGAPTTFRQVVECRITRSDGSTVTIKLRSRLDSARDFKMWSFGGVDAYLSQKYGGQS